MPESWRLLPAIRTSSDVLITDQVAELVKTQVEAVKNIKIDKVTVGTGIMPGMVIPLPLILFQG